MTCDFLERHFLSGTGPEELALHIAGCASCRRLSADLESLAEWSASLRTPDASENLTTRWLSIPSLTVNCDEAAELMAGEIEREIPSPDKARLAFHLSRCEACQETAQVLGVMANLNRPEPGEFRPVRPHGTVIAFPRRPKAATWWLDPRLYAAAACLLAGFLTFAVSALRITPVTDARSASATVLDSLRVRVNDITDRLQMLEQNAPRQIVATRETLFGYGKAAGNIVLSAAFRTTEGLLEKKGNKL